MKHLYLLIFFLLFTLIGYPALAQQPDTMLSRLQKLPSNYIVSADDKMTRINHQITIYTNKVLQRQQQMEEGINAKLMKVDSVASHNLFAYSLAKYQNLLNKIRTKATSLAPFVQGGSYFPYLDTLRNSLFFLKKYSAYLNQIKNSKTQIQASLNNFNHLETKFQNVMNIEQYLQQRQAQITTVLSKYGNMFNRQIRSLSKNVYYYVAQIKEYKNTFQDPSRAEAQAFKILRTTKLFKIFMKKNSMLASLLNLPSNTGISDTSGTSIGLQSRSQVISKIQSGLGPSGTNAATLIQQKTQAAEGQLDQFRNKLNSLYKIGGLVDIPNFTPNDQKTKSFFKRIVWGTNLQTTRGNYYFPTTTDVGLSIGYKLNNKNQIGIGASYNVGWGSNYSHIKLSSQGIGFRSFIDLQLIKTIFISGGLEYNYRQPFSSLHIIQTLRSWQQSGLIGISKIISMKTQFFTSTKIQLLWDFLSYEQVPKTQPFLLRMGYNF